MAFGVMLVVSSVTTGVGLLQVSKMRAATKDMMERTLIKERVVSDLYRIIFAGARRTLAIAKSTDNSLVEYFAADSAQGTKEAGEIVKQVNSLLTSPEETTKLKEVSDARDLYNKYKAMLVKAKAANDTATVAAVLDPKFVPAEEAYQQRLRELVAFERAGIDAAGQELDAAAATSLHLQTALTLLLIALVIVAGWALERSIVGPLAYAIGVARRVAKGDLTSDVTVTSKDEAGQLLQALGEMNGSLRSLIDGVLQSADTIAGASGEIAQGNADLSTRTESQAASIEETASSMEELTSTVAHNADNATLASKLALSASQVAVMGGDVVGQAMATMAEIKQGSQRISEITSIIDGIAFQTNILALNAAVEAARAGEQGRGFAVVASEVRSLAQRSAAAAKEIGVLISDSVDKVNTGSKLVDGAGATMNDIVKSIKEVAQIMTEITAATREQTTGLESINLVIAEMDNATRMNAAMVEEASAAAMTMQEEAGRLSDAVSMFRTKKAAGRAPALLR
jgi:methyl-accepting chemotaxis protein